MIEHNPYSDDRLLRGSDLEFLIEAINGNEVFVDGDTAAIDKSPAGTLIRILAQAGGGGGSAAEAVETHPFKMSIGTNESQEKICTITSGLITTDTPYNVPEGIVNLNSYGEGTVYIYAKIEQDWEVGTELRSYPLLTVQTGVGVTNFAGNDVKFPATDFGTFFQAIGTIVITDTATGGDPPSLKYEINQLINDNVTIPGKTYTAFKLVQFFETKGSDTADDTSVILYCMAGKSNTPDGEDNIPTSTQTVSTSSTQQVHLNVTSTKSGGYYSGYASAVVFQNNPSGSDANLYYLIGTGGGSISQSLEGNFISTSRIL